MNKLPPVMGWSTWNQFHQHINETLILEVAEKMKANGLLDAGYRYINLDDCWQASSRDASLRLQFDIGRFPGKESIIKKLNDMGFKAGLYSSCGELTCEDMPGSYGYEDLDAKTFADWGAEYLKYDYCHVVDLPTDPHYEGKNFAAYTPPIIYIGISEIGKSGNELQIDAADLEITAPAYLQNNSVCGLNCPDASVKITINVTSGGLYQLSAGYKKEASIHRGFLLITVNDTEDVQLWFPPTSGWNSPARVMADVELRAGENTLVLTNPIRGQKEDSKLRYARMGNALKKASLPDKPIFYSICEHGRTEPWTWAGEMASSWRVSHDIRADWKGIMFCYEAAADLWPFQSPGAYNDPDMLEVGVGNLTETENQSHFVLWCMMSAPLILGLDVRKADEKTISLITNPEIIALNQKGLLLQASRIKLRDDMDLLIKPLTEKSCAICFFNKSEVPMAEFSISIDELLGYDNRVCFNAAEGLKAQNMLGNMDWFSLDDVLQVPETEAHGVALFTISII